MSTTTLPQHPCSDPIAIAAQFLAKYLLEETEITHLFAGQTYQDALAHVTGHAEPYDADEVADVFDRIVRRYTDDVIEHLKKGGKLPGMQSTRLRSSSSQSRCCRHEQLPG
jgi:hypothetical protein